MRTLLLACATVLLATIDSGGQSAPVAAVFVWGFQQGNVASVDLLTGRVLRRFALRDRSGIASVAPSADGRTLFVLDDQDLRVLDAVTGRVQSRHPLDDMRHMLGGGPYIHLAGDGRFLLVRTFDLESAASGVRIFDVASRAFLGVGLRARACADPELASASQGSLFALCPGLIQAMKPGGRTDEFTETGRAEIRAEKIASFIATRGDQVYALESQGAGMRWQIHRWSPGEKGVTTTAVDLGGVKADTQQADLAASPDGKSLALLRGSQVLLFDLPDLRQTASFDLPATGSDVALSADGLEVLVLASDPARIFRIPVDGGQTRVVPIDGLSTARGPRLLAVAGGVRPLRSPR